MAVKFVKLSEIAHIESGGTPSSDNPAYWNGDIHWATLVDVKNKYVKSTRRKITAEGLKHSSAKLLPIGTVLFSSRATIGEVSIAKVELATNQGFKNFLCDSNRIIPEYLYFVLKYNAKKIANSVSSTTFKEISKTKLGEYKIPLCSLEEQEKIVNLLDQLNELRIKRKLAIGLLDEYLKAVFLDMFGSNSKDFCTWEEVEVQDLAAKSKNSMRTGPFGSDLKHSEFVSSGVAVLGIDNAVKNKFEWKERRFITQEKFQKLKRYKVYPRDVIVTIMATIGRSAVVPDDIPLSINTKHLATITLDSLKANPYFFSYSLHSDPQIIRQIKLKNIGAIMPGLNLSIIKSLKIKKPPIELQNKFEDIYCNTQNIRENMITQSQVMDNNFQALMQKIFRT